MDLDYREHGTWALASEDGLIEVVTGNLDQAYAQAARYGVPVLDAYGEREKTFEEPPAAMAANPRSLPSFTASPKVSLGRTGLPKVDLDKLLRKYPLGPGGSPSFASEGLLRAHADLVGHFPTKKLQQGQWRPVTKWQSPDLMAADLLGDNLKMGRPRTLEDGTLAVARGLSLLPHAMAFKMAGLGDGTLCLWSTPQCRSMCLVFSGQNKSDPYNQGLKLAKTKALLVSPEAFCRMLLAAVHSFSCGVGCAAQTPFVRLNVYSDVPWELFFPGLFEFYEDVGFYDYTKVPGRKTPDNYDLTFSVSGTPENIGHAKKEIDRGRKICAVFLLPPGADFPATFAVGGDEEYRLDVIDGTADDIRSLDPAPSVVALSWKPPFRKRKGAVVRTLRTKGFDVFVVPVVVDADGNVIAAETPRYTAAAATEETAAEEG